MNDIAASPVSRLASRAILPATSPASWLRNLLPNPLLDMTEDAKAYHLAVELPGLDEQDVEVTITDSMLAITGEKRVTRDEQSQDFLLRERHYGKFTRSLLIPVDVDLAEISAKFNRGVMEITMPKGGEGATRTRKIAVTAAKD
ncbi:MAG: hypothetical protein RL480_2559 [Pseudomonadota bacterium]|jgi:HSP20 family protein